MSKQKNGYRCSHAEMANKTIMHKSPINFGINNEDGTRGSYENQ